MKYHYSVNPDNRLLVKSSSTKRFLAVDGRFGLDKNNQLVYWLNEPVSWRRKYGFGNKIVFKGQWQLNPNYDLEFTLAQNSSQFRNDRLAIKGEIVSCDNDELAFEVATIDKRGLTHIQLLKLSGAWQADELNRISFVVEKKASPETLTLQNIWQVNRNQQITFSYEKINLKTKTKISRNLTFQGFWQINSANRLTYILSHSSKSIFDFRAQLESPNLYPKEKAIKYRIGIGLREDRPQRVKIISLYGAWKFSRKLGVLFEMEYGRGNIRALKFDANANLSKKDQITLSLLARKGEPLGINLTFRHRFLKKLDAEAFLKLKKLEREAGIEAGLRIPF